MELLLFEWIKIYTNINPIIKNTSPIIRNGIVAPFQAGLFVKALHLKDNLLIPMKKNPINKIIILNKNKLFAIKNPYIKATKIKYIISLVNLLRVFTFLSYLKFHLLLF